MARSKEDMDYPNRLNELIEKTIPSGSTKEEKRQKFADENFINENTLKRYVYGTAKIPDELASELAEKYNVTVDWLMYYKLNDYDVMEILKAFSKIFRVVYKNKPIFYGGERSIGREATLCMDGKFFSFLTAMQQLQLEKERDISLDNETYGRRMDKIFSEFKDYFMIKFNTGQFDVSRALDIDFFELFYDKEIFEEIIEE